MPGIGADDKILLWPGGIWNWFDPLTVIRAVHELSRRRDDVRLYFLGVKHPNPEVPDMAMAAEAVALADELGLRDRVVFFNFGWVPYAERGRYLLDADVAVSAHFDDIETRFAFRTRLLDCLWAGLPVVTTRGDTLGGCSAIRSVMSPASVPVRSFVRHRLRPGGLPRPGGRPLRGELEEVATALQVSAWSLVGLAESVRGLLPQGRVDRRARLRRLGGLAGLRLDGRREGGPRVGQPLPRPRPRSRRGAVNLVAAGPLRRSQPASIPGFAAFEDVWNARAPLGWDIADAEPVARS